MFLLISQGPAQAPGPLPTISSLLPSTAAWGSAHYSVTMLYLALIPNFGQCFLCLQHLEFLSLTMYMLFSCHVASSPCILSKASHAYPSPQGSLQFLMVSTSKSNICMALPLYWALLGLAGKKLHRDGVLVLLPPEFIHLLR